MEARLQLVITSSCPYRFRRAKRTGLLIELSTSMRFSSDDAARPKSLPSPKPRPANWWGNLAMAGLPVLACLFGGATEKWSEGIVIALLGLFLLVAPPRFSLGPWAQWNSARASLCAAVAFLPARWFFEPAWRTALVNDFRIQLPIHAESSALVDSRVVLISFSAGLSWLYCVTAEELELRAVRPATSVVCRRDRIPWRALPRTLLCRNDSADFGVINAASVRSQIAIRPAIFLA